ncbi:MAG: DNA methyltransferase, partial [Spirochaetota bacterium]
MPSLSWNEIKTRAVEFSKEWENESNEDAEAKSFWDNFFNVFGISRRRVATFEKLVNKSADTSGYIDLLWKSVILIEHKSRGKDLDKAYKQAIEYFPGLKESELPKYVLVSDFARFRLYDLEESSQHEFVITDLVNNVHLFGFIAGYQKKLYKEEDPVNIEAAERMGRLHDKLLEIGYSGHFLEIYLVRLLFCLFSDDTGIFEKNLFHDYIETKTSVDGSDLAAHLSTLFYVLNTPPESRLTNLDESLASFPYIDGKLFEENIPPASFDSQMKQLLLDCCDLNWGKISPAIFGSLFQSVMDPEKRRNIGGHYTSEKNILKLIKPLFLDELWDEFSRVKNNRNKLSAFHNKISKLKFLDPACGCGNFLIITYREIRLLELEILKVLYSNEIETGQHVFEIDEFELFIVDVDSFYGIEIEEFPARIAEVSMWMMDHQMNMKVSEAFGEYYSRLPLKNSANIVIGNALRVNWNDIMPSGKLSYILGNPPFIGKHLQNKDQGEDTEIIFKDIKGSGVLDYVTCWYIKAAQYIQKTNIKVAFVSTNSISQGEQVGILWNALFNKYNIKIHFAHS